MNNAFCYSRDKEISLYGTFSLRMEGACLTLMRYMVIYANHSPGHYASHPIQRSEIAASLKHLELHTGLSQKTIRNALDHLQKANEVCQKGAIKGANRTMLYCIVNYEDWDDSQKKGQSEGQARGKQGATSKEEIKKKKEETSTFVASHDAIRCLKAWEQYRPIIEKHRTTYLKVFDDLHTLDKLPWEGEDGIFAICAFAVKEWTTAMIQAPSKLRKSSQKYPELKTWQVILGQIRNPAQRVGGSNERSRASFGTIARGLEQAADNLAHPQLRVISPQATQNLLPEPAASGRSRRTPVLPDGLDVSVSKPD